MSKHIIVSNEGFTRTIAMRRPEKRNALTREMFLAMSEAIDSAQSNSAIRCLILAGRSGVFSAGDDLSEILDDADTAPESVSGRLVLLRSLINSRKPLVAAVDGPAVGTGATMVLHCDYVIAGTTASFSYPMIRYGLLPTGASSLLLSRMAGCQRAFSMLLMGRAMSAEQAREAGLVNVVVPPGHAINEAQRLAREIGELQPDAVALSRELLKPSMDELLRRMDEEEQLFAERLRLPSVIAALSRFLARNED
ncbi:enoyl-CoA hydratase-related protein [Bradyrhizobium sp. Tv2a-2]|uniref:enoyl-CoA hydratase/isomerase family protein n=1 Tax=Bradyrhizobium sp. Tv2a-2 TaxID=113395 RepID=UPI00041C5A65|nr:enoyl-CoA hydratase-related protein [Bradyrhizobium sp. Tv2a-2]